MNKSRPNLFIVGAPKCGTTAWVAYLSRHPDIFFCDPKEPHHFNSDIPNFRWFKTQDDYLELFAAAGSERIRAEASILYLYSLDAAANIAQFNRDAKILIFVRDPAKFISSYHQQQLYNLDEDVEDLGEAWSLSGQRSAAALPKGCRDARLLDYKSIGAFGAQSERYVANFGRNQVRIVRFEEWVRAPRETYLALMDFLEVDDDGQTNFPQVNAAHDHRFKAVANITQRPPRLARLFSRALRRLPGMGAFRPARLLRKLNRSEGYRKAQLDPQLREEIAAHYRDDQSLLATLYERVGLVPTDSAWVPDQRPKHVTKV